MKEENPSSKGEAHALGTTECPAYQQKTRRAAEHKEHNEKVKENFPLITKYKELHTLTRDEIKADILAPQFQFPGAKVQAKG